MQQTENQPRAFLAETELPVSFSSGLSKKAFWLGLSIIAVVAVAAVLWVVWGLQNREQEFAEHVEKRLELMASSEKQMLEELTQEPKRQASRVINSELFRLYAAEVHLIGGDISRLIAGLAEDEAEDSQLMSLAAQLPMMQDLLTEFIQIAGYQAGRVVNQDKTVYLATDAKTTPLRPDQIALVEEALNRGQDQVGPLRHSANGLLLDVYLPIFPPEARGLGDRPVSVLVLSKAVSDRLNELRDSNVLVEEGERVRLVQKVAGGYQEVVPWLPGQLREVNFAAQLDQSGAMPFALRQALTGEKKVYSLAYSLPEPDWWVVAEADYQIARESLRTHQRAVISFASLLILFFGVTFGAIWAAMASTHDRKVARHFETLAARIDQQRQLLGRINNTISDFIVLKDLQGIYRYVNPAFAEAVGRSAKDLIGQSSEAVFGFDTARRLGHSDQQVLATGEPVTLKETVYLQSQPHHLQISKAPLKDAQGKVSGIVSVSRDITDLIEMQKRREQATHKTVEALVRAVELTDPYLAGHSRLMGALAVQVAKVLNASDQDIATVETAANLCQVGKLFVDRNILFKAAPLTAEEMKEMESHVEHAARVLRDIDFGLPVFDTVYQMNESMNGQGYPRGLTGDEIAFTARILGVVNSFCAMVKPRAYRGARTIEESLDILASADQIYDQQVVAALEEVVHSAVGEKLLMKEQTSG